MKGTFSLNIVDVRDTALAHVLALERPEAGGERFAISSGPFYWDELSLSPVYFFRRLFEFTHPFTLLYSIRGRCDQGWC